MLLELRLYIFARDLILALIPAALPQVVIHRSNTSQVRPPTPSGTSTPYIAEVVDHFIEVQWSLYTQPSGQIVYVLLISIFAVVTKQNVLAGAAYLFLRRHERRDLDCVLFFQSPDSVHYTRRCTHCLHHQKLHWQLVFANCLLVFDGEVALGTVG